MGRLRLLPSPAGALTGSLGEVGVAVSRGSFGTQCRLRQFHRNALLCLKALRDVGSAYDRLNNQQNISRQRHGDTVLCANREKNFSPKLNCC
eukprot:2044839-Amphidinium_carterae.1